MDDAGAIAAAQALFENGVDTYVVGVGNDAAAWQSIMAGMAQAGSGGTRDYIQVNDTQAVNDAFKEIIARATSCEFPIDWENMTITESAKNCTLVEVFQTENGVVPDGAVSMKRDDACADGTLWHFKDLPVVESSTPLSNCAVVELCPDLCHQLKYSELDGLSSKFGCPPPPIK